MTQLITKGHRWLRPLVGDLKGEVVVLNHLKLPARQQMPRFQLVSARGGFGCEDGSMGRKVFGSHLADGGDCTYYRSSFVGIATPELIALAMADTTPVKAIDLSLREYLLIAKDGSTERGQTVEQARQRLRLISSACVVAAYEVHPESWVTELGFISYPDGAPPVEVRIRKGKEWTASH